MEVIYSPNRSPNYPKNANRIEYLCKYTKKIRHLCTIFLHKCLILVEATGLEGEKNAEKPLFFQAFSQFFAKLPHFSFKTKTCISSLKACICGLFHYPIRSQQKAELEGARSFLAAPLPHRARRLDLPRRQSKSVPFPRRWARPFPNHSFFGGETPPLPAPLYVRIRARICFYINSLNIEI